MTGTTPAQGCAGIINGPKPLMMKKTANSICCFSFYKYPMNAETADRLGLPQNTLDKLTSVFKRYDAIEAVLIYSSRAKGNYRRGSDIDLTIKGHELEFAELRQIEDQIDDLFLPYTVDLYSGMAFLLRFCPYA